MPEQADTASEEWMAHLQRLQEVEDTHSWVYGRNSVRCARCGVSKSKVRHTMKECGSRYIKRSIIEDIARD